MIKETYKKRMCLIGYQFLRVRVHDGGVKAWHQEQLSAHILKKFESTLRMAGGF